MKWHCNGTFTTVVSSFQEICKWGRVYFALGVNKQSLLVFHPDLNQDRFIWSNIDKTHTQNTFIDSLRSFLELRAMQVRARLRSEFLRLLGKSQMRQGNMVFHVWVWGTCKQAWGPLSQLRSPGTSFKKVPVVY